MTNRTAYTFLHVRCVKEFVIHLKVVSYNMAPIIHPLRTPSIDDERALSTQHIDHRALSA
jgi:hypothetical protein